jgi:hypothetical protein
MYKTCANLTDPGQAMSDASVDDWQEILAHHLADVNAYRSTAETQWWQLVLAVLCYCNVVHL